jgi:Flp pilus assembly protein TadB
MAKVCVICEKEVRPGEKAFIIKDDAVIKSIRRFKQALGIAKNNTLMVHETCLEQYSLKRKQFERRMLFAIIFAVVVVVGLNILQVMAGIFSLNILLFSIVLSLFPLILVLLTTYCPEIEKEKEQKNNKEVGKKEKKKIQEKKKKNEKKGDK